jgi:hypothetical protein
MGIKATIIYYHVMLIINLVCLNTIKVYINLPHLCNILLYVIYFTLAYIRIHSSWTGFVFFP